MNMAKNRPNVIPIIEDARHPQKYRMLVPMVDAVFADVAQPDQVCLTYTSMTSLGFSVLGYGARWRWGLVVGVVTMTVCHRDQLVHFGLFGLYCVHARLQSNGIVLSLIHLHIICLIRTWMVNIQ